MEVAIYSYNRGEGAKALKAALGCKFIALENSKYKGNPKKTVINWGSSDLPAEVRKSKVLNNPDAVKKAVDKRLAFDAFSTVMETIPYTTKKDEALKWLKDGKTIVVREKVNGKGGDGITIVENALELPDAPLYTQYVPKTEEYRIHVFQGKVIFQQRKARKNDIADDKINWKIRNLANGFIFANKDIDIDEVGKKMAIDAIKSLGLDFGSVDMIYNKTKNKFFVLEVNTASGLQGSTIDAYEKAFKEYLNK